MCEREREGKRRGDDGAGAADRLIGSSFAKINGLSFIRFQMCS